MESILKVTNLKQEFRVPGGKPKLVLRDLNFSLPKGALVGFIGVNGAGKTTTLKVLLGFIYPQAGRVEFFGTEELTSEVRKRLGFMPERPYFYEFLSGREFLALHWKLRGLPTDRTFEQRCDEVLKSVDLERGKHLRLRQFSKGMLQRIGIAQAIMHRPDLLILDEPMSGLDPDGRVLIKQIIRNLHSAGTTIFFSSHLLQDMEELCTSLIIIDQGAIIYQGDLEGLGAHRTNDYTITWYDPGSKQMNSEISRGEDLQNKIDGLRGQQCEIRKIQQRQISLEEAFILLRKSKE